MLRELAQVLVGGEGLAERRREWDERRARWDVIRHHERRASAFRELAEEHDTKATRLLREQLTGEEA